MPSTRSRAFSVWSSAATRRRCPPRSARCVARAACGSRASAPRGTPRSWASICSQASASLARRRGRLARHRRFWFVGGGPNAATAREGALKLSETAWLPAVAFEPESFLHGPSAALEADDALVLIAPPGPARARALDVARTARAIGAEVLVLGREDDREAAGLAGETIALPEVDEAFSPILAVVPLQLLAYHVAVARGRNPDLLRADDPAHARARAALAS